MHDTNTDQKSLRTSSVFTIANESTKTRFNNQFYNIEHVTLTKTHLDKTYGFTVAGYCPCHVESIIGNSPAARVNLQESDLIVKINNTNCCRATLKTVLSLIKSSASNQIHMTVYRLSNPKSRNSSKLVKSSATKKAKKTSYLGKLFRPSIRWLTCAAPLNLTKINNCSSIASNQTLNQTHYSKQDVITKDHTISNILTSSSQIGADTGYETLSRHDDSNDYTIETITNTTNSYSDCDLTVSQRSFKEAKVVTYGEQFNEEKTQLIGELIEMEANFVSYLSMAVATLARPLRGFFMQQQDYFILFQNIEKILIISENFLRSMDKWSALDLYSRIGQLYTQKLNLFREAFTTYAKGHGKAKCLLNDLKTHSKQFRLFLNETQSENMTLSNLIDLPLIHINETLNYFKQIRRFTDESKRNPSEAPHIDSVIFELRKVLAISSVSVDQLQMENSGCQVVDEEIDMDSCDETCYDQDYTTNSMFMSTTINDVTLTVIDSFDGVYIGGSRESLTSSSDESASDFFYSTSSD